MTTTNLEGRVARLERAYTARGINLAEFNTPAPPADEEAAGGSGESKPEGSKT